MPNVHALADLIFLHLSDIHFQRGCVGDVHDQNAEVRNELQRDIRRLRSILPRVDGIVISGDIAFGGKSEEYEYATNWLDAIREAVDCPKLGIMVTPGNHDIDRDMVGAGSDARVVQERIRSATTHAERDRLLATALRDPSDGDALIKPLTAYNAFAKEYGCDISRTRPFWERSFPLPDGSCLRFRGLTTTLLSGPEDDDQTHKMLYGSAQRTLLRHSGIRHIVIGHHPPSWSIEGDNADRTFSTIATVQGFGHTHDQWITASPTCVRVIAGAFHPDRAEPQWLPRYSALAFSVVDDRRLRFRVYPRRWTFESMQFMADFTPEGRIDREYVLDVEPLHSD